MFTNISCSLPFCRIIGAILIVMGLYSVLWGKYKESKEAEEEAIIEAVKDVKNQMKMGGHEDLEANDIEMQKNKELAMAPKLAFNASVPTPPMLAVETRKP